MSTRKRTKRSSPGPSETASNLPPPRKSKALKPVSLPLTNTRLNRLIYLLALLSVLLCAYYSWRVAQWKSEVGGWWNLAIGKRPPQMKTQSQPVGGGSSWMGWKGQPKKSGKISGDNSVEDRINALAEALGMPSRDLASAIAGAVREYVPPASLSSIAAQQQETGKGKRSDVVDELLKGRGRGSENKEGSTGIFDEVAGGFGSVVGMDEPPEQA